MNERMCCYVGETPPGPPYTPCEKPAEWEINELDPSMFSLACDDHVWKLLPTVDYVAIDSLDEDGTPDNKDRYEVKYINADRVNVPPTVMDNIRVWLRSQHRDDDGDDIYMLHQDDAKALVAERP